jgi:hypothetical protein
VRVPQISGTSTTIDVDYGHGAPVAPSPDSVWVADYALVMHFASLADATRNHHDATWAGGTMSAADGKIGPTFDFDGTNDAMVIADAADLDFGTHITVSGWINSRSLASGSGFFAIVSRQNGASIHDDFWLGVDAMVDQACTIVSTPQGFQLGPTTEPVILDTWTHLVMTYDGAIERLYADGLEVGTFVVSGAIFHDAKPILIGADHNAGGAPPSADFVNGLLDEVRLEHTTRTPAWIAYDELSQRDDLIAYGPVNR